MPPSLLTDRVDGPLLVGEADVPDVYLLRIPGTRATVRAAAWRFSSASSRPYSSRSYSVPLTLVALHERPVGVDVERISTLDHDEITSILTPRERKWLTSSTPEEITSIWSGKEALAKALGDAVAYDPRRLDAPCTWERGEAGRFRARRLDVGQGFVAWACWQV